MPNKPKPEYIEGPKATERFSGMLRRLLGVTKEDVEMHTRRRGSAPEEKRLRKRPGT